MPRLVNSVPKYRKHASGQAVVRIGGRDFYLGKFGTAASKQDYDMSDPDPRAFYPAFAAAVQDDLDAPGMEGCDANGITPLPAIPRAAGIGTRSATAGTGS